MIYYIIFFYLFLLSIIFDFSEKYSSCKIYCYLYTCLLLIIFAGFRYRVGLDSIRITDWYNDCPNLWQIDINYIRDSKYQPLWVLLCSSLKILSPSFVLLQIAQSFIVNTILFYLFKKNTKYIFSSVLFYYILAYIPFNFEIMREAIAISFSMLGFYNFTKRKYLNCLFYSFIAIEFHISAVSIIFIYLVQYIKYKNMYLLFVLVLTSFITYIYNGYIDFLFLLILGNSDSLSKNIMTYSGAGGIGTSSMYYINMYFNYFILPVLAIWFYKKKKRNNYKYSSALLLYILFQTLGNVSVAFSRFSNYQLFFYIIILAEDYGIYLNYKKKYIFVKGIALCFLVSFSYLYILNKPIPYIPNAKSYCRYYPYYSIFNEKKNPEREKYSEVELM